VEQGVVADTPSLNFVVQIVVHPAIENEEMRR
jgi:hypothetical protein